MSQTSAAVRVIGTAGHVDHGKSALIKALTGSDPDRLREEQERGMTIDLGFAHLRLPGGAEVGIVDVPGHHDLIRNMLAGVGTIDAVVLVVAADEGVMAQTREHVAILSLLGIERGVVALTKRDLVDEPWADLVAEDVRALVADTPLRGAPIVRASSVTRQGLDELVASLEAVLGAAPARRDIGRPRLAIDRAFTMPGFGTVVTGTLVDGSLAVGDEVEIVPARLRSRIRSLQTHRRAVDVAPPGRRVALNLVGVAKEELARGMVVVRPGSLAPTDTLSLRLGVLPGASAPLGHGEEVKVHVGTAEVMARAAVLEGDEIAPGEERWAQLRLAAAVAAAAGDRLVVRRPSPSETLGGGVVADASGERFRRRAEAVATLVQRAAPSPATRLLASLEAPRALRDAAARSGLSPDEAEAARRELVGRGDAVDLGVALLSARAYGDLATRVERMLAAAHRSAPLRPGPPREEVRSALGLPPRIAAAVLDRLVADRKVVDRDGAYALPSHRVALLPQHERAWERARQALAGGGVTATELETTSGIGGDLLAALASRGEVVRAGDMVFLPALLEREAEKVIDELAAAGRITVARARDLTGTSRKQVLPLLQFLDDRGVTRRIGDDRVLVHAAAEAKDRLRIALRRGMG